MIAIYDPVKNSVIIDERALCSDNIPDKFIVLVMIHELLHMASTDREKNICGFQNGALPTSYNEALVQWLALRLYFGKEKMDEIVEKNPIYSKSVKLLNSMIKEMGEENVYRGFFEGNIKLNKQGLNATQKNKWMDYILKFSFYADESQIQKSIQALYECKENNSHQNDEPDDIEQ